MANIKVSEMTEATSFDDGDYTMIVQANQNKKISKENIFSNLENEISTNASDISTINTNIGDLSDLATEDKTSLVNATNEIVNSKQYLQQAFQNVSCTQNYSNLLTSLTLSKGIWIVTGQFLCDVSNLRYYFSITIPTLEAVQSSYDNAGGVGANLSAILNLEGETTIGLKLWPTNKDVTANGWLKAVKYQ